MSAENVSISGRSFSDVPPPTGFEDTGNSVAGKVKNSSACSSDSRRSYRRSTNRMSIPPAVGLDETCEGAGGKCEMSFRNQLMTHAPVVAEAMKERLEDIVRKELESAGIKVNVDRVVERLKKTDICDKALEGYSEDSNPDFAEDDFRFTWRSISKLREESNNWQELVNKTNAALRAKSSLSSVLGDDGGDVHQPTIAKLKRSLKDIKDLDQLINAREAVIHHRIKNSAAAVETRTEYLKQKEDMLKAEMKD